MLGGGLAAWARGGPPTDHDVDLYVREADAEAGLNALVAAGMRAERPPEEWLYKAYDGPILVDLIFCPAGGAIGDEHFARADKMEVGAQTLLVASIDDVLSRSCLRSPSRSRTSSLCSSWRARCASRSTGSSSAPNTADSPFARAFFTLVEGLGIVEPEGSVAA